jgi:hypothetical protein
MSANIKASVDGTQAIIGVGGVDQMTVSNAGVVTANSFVGAISNTNVTATGSTTARTLANRFADVVNVKDFGAVGDGVADDTDAIQAAINYAAAFPYSGAKIVFNGNEIYYFTNLTFPANTSGNTNGGIILDGNGCRMVKTSATGTGILVQGAAGNRAQRRQNSIIRNIKFSNNIAQTSGDLIKVLNSDHTFLEYLDIESFYNAITVVDSFDTRISNNYIRNSQSKDIYVYGSSGFSTIETIITNTVGEGVSGNITKTGLTIDSGVSGVFVTNCDFTQGSTGIEIKHSVQANPLFRPEWLFFSIVLCDTNDDYGWAISGDVEGMYLSQCWGCTCGINGFGINAGSTIFLNDCIAQNNGQHGVNITGAATEIHIKGGIYACNSTSATNTYNGINVAGGISNFSVINTRCGNVPSLGNPGIQQVGIYVNNGASNNYQLIGNNCLDNQTAPLVSLGTGTNKKFSDNLGYNPVGNVTVPLPASGVSYTNNLGIDGTVYLKSGTVTDIEVNYKGTGWVSTGFITGTISVPANSSIRITYSVAPTWIWFFN